MEDNVPAKHTSVTHCFGQSVSPGCGLQHQRVALSAVWSLWEIGVGVLALQMHTQL